MGRRGVLGGQHIAGKGIGQKAGRSQQHYGSAEVFGVDKFGHIIGRNDILRQGGQQIHQHDFHSSTPFFSQRRILSHIFFQK